MSLSNRLEAIKTRLRAIDLAPGLNALETSEKLDTVSEELDDISSDLQDLSEDYWSKSDSDDS